MENSEASREVLTSIDIDDPNSTILVEDFVIGTGEVFLLGHECDNPEHAKGTAVGIVALVILDADGNQKYVVFAKDSDPGKKLASSNTLIELQEKLTS